MECYTSGGNGVGILNTSEQFVNHNVLNKVIKYFKNINIKGDNSMRRDSEFHTVPQVI